MTGIKCFSAEGNRLSDRSLASVERLLDLYKVRVVRNRRNEITSIHFRHEDGGNSIQTKVPSGKSTVENELLPSGHHAWRHRDNANL